MSTPSTPARTETAEQRKARIRAGMMAHFEDTVRNHFANPPDTFTVVKKADRCWQVIDRAGDNRSLGGYKTRKAAVEALTTGRYRQWWDERTDWYREVSRDPRVRKLDPDERAIVARVLNDIDYRQEGN